MTQTSTKSWLPHVLIVAGFFLIAALFCYPALQGKVLEQHDIVSWKATAHEAMEWNEKTGETTLWSNSQFGGMPTYTFYVTGTNNFLVPVYDFFTQMLPKPANFFLLAMLCFYVLMNVLRFNRWLGAIAAVAFAFASYNPIIISAGHDTKMIAMGLMPLVLAGLILLFRREYIAGAALTAVAFSLMCITGHYQIIYYMGIIILLACAGMFIQCIRSGKAQQGFLAGLISLASLGIGVATTMAIFLPTQEYAKETMRGGSSELTITGHDANKKETGGLNKEYAFRWSNGIGETFCILVPYLYGGSSAEPVSKLPAADELLGGQAEQLPAYWGDQPFLSGPVYFGAAICFLFVLGLLIVRSPHKWWILVASAIGIVMSWGSNFASLNYFLFDAIPYLNKFRTPSMILIIPQFLFPLLGAWAVNDILKGKVEKEVLAKKIITAAAITGGLALILGLFGSMFFDFSGPADKQFPEQIRSQLVAALREDRAAMARNSGLLSAFYIAAAAALLWLFAKGRMGITTLLAGLGIIIAIDLIPVAAHYLPEDKYVDADVYETIFAPRPVDQQILQDKDPYYRVFDLSRDPFNDALQAYWHKCVGGYSPAKLEVYQDLIDVHLSKGMNASVLNMLNTKYIIAGQGGQPMAFPNPGACGNAWFVSDIKWVKTADEEILALNGPLLGDTAQVANAWNPLQTAVLRSHYQNELNGYAFGKDSSAAIRLTKYGLNDLSFASQNSQNGLAVFSDIWYPHGWKAYIDGQETPIIRVNYLLRGLKIPAGQHEIVFKFRPESYATGNTISLITSLLVLALCVLAGLWLWRKHKQSETGASHTHQA